MILILSPSKEEFQRCIIWRSSFNGLRMRMVGAGSMATALLALAHTPAYACTCKPRTAAEIVAAADVAVVGMVTDVRRTEAGKDAGHGGTVIATISVSRIIKGRIHRQIQLRTPGSETVCGVTFVEGTVVRIAADKLNDGLNTTLCMLLVGPIPAD